MNLLLSILLLFITPYPSIKLLIYMPLRRTIQGHEKAFSYSLIGTCIVLGSFVVLFFGITSQFQILSIYNNSILSMGSQIAHSMLPVVSAITIFCSVVLLFLSMKSLKSSNDETKIKLVELRFDILFSLLTIGAHLFTWFLLISLNQSL